ncbi:MAG: MFS transporter, partial [Desulfobacterales bacterium]|nr:MFS transporter [Desulfobacterales bacterium]
MNPALLILAAGLFTWGLGEGIFFFFQPLYLAELGADPLEIGTILGGAGVAMTLVHIPAGYLADKFGRRPLIRTAWASGLIFSIVMASARTLPLFVIGLIFYSFTTFVISPLNSYVTAARGKLSVERVLTFISAVFSLGMVLGPLLGGWLGDRFGLRSLYIVASGIFVISTTLIFSLPPQPVHEARAEFSPKTLL